MTTNNLIKDRNLCQLLPPPGAGEGGVRGIFFIPGTSCNTPVDKTKRVPPVREPAYFPGFRRGTLRRDCFIREFCKRLPVLCKCIVTHRGIRP
jgi:hypothetical protein